MGLTDQGPGSRQGFPVLVLYGGRESLGLREGDKRCCGFDFRQWRHPQVCGDSQCLAVLCVFGDRSRYEQLSEVGTMHPHCSGADMIGPQPPVFEPSMQGSCAHLEQLGSLGNGEQFVGKIRGRHKGSISSRRVHVLSHNFS